VVYLARKITRAKWDATEFTGPDGIRADAITTDLRTYNDTLSFWRCNSDLGDVADVVLALAASMERVDRVQVVLLPEDDLAVTCKLNASPENAHTPVTGLRERHVDLIQLDMVQLCFIAKQIATALRAASDNLGGLNYQQFSVKQVGEIVSTAVRNNRVTLAFLITPLCAWPSAFTCCNQELISACSDAATCSTFRPPRRSASPPPGAAGARNAGGGWLR
jgi:hypothetical protein